MVNLDDVTAHHRCQCLALPTVALITAECVIVKTRGLSHLLQVRHHWQLTLTTSLPTICISVWHSPFPHNLWVQRTREPDNSEKVPAPLVTFFYICFLPVASVSCGAGVFCVFFVVFFFLGGGPRLPSAHMHIKDILWAKMEIMPPPTLPPSPLIFQDAKYRSNHCKKDDYSWLFGL